MRAPSFIPAQSALVLIFDAVLAALLYVGSIYVFVDDPDLFLWDSNGWMRVVLAVASIVGGLYFNDLYSDFRVRSRVALALQLLHVFGLSLIFQTLLAYLDVDLALPRRVTLIGAIAGFLVLFSWRVFFGAFLWRFVGLQNVLMVGSGWLAGELARVIAARPERGLRLVGYVGDPVDESVLPAHYLGPFVELNALCAELKPDRLIVAASGAGSDVMPTEELLKVRHSGVPIEDGTRTYETLCGRVCAPAFRPAQFIFDNTLVHRPGSLALQSIYINVLALAGIFVMSPVLILIAIFVILTTRGPVLDPVPCIGYRGIPFNLNRFRVSRRDAVNGRVRVDGLGQFLRRTHLELLPALLNLLRGELALVGPRPHRSEYCVELAARIPFFEQRYALKPGLTGWSQINMDTTSEPADALASLEYDLYYLKNMSLALDAYILVHRLRRIFTFAS